MIKRALLIIALLPGIACAEQQNLNYTTKTDWKTEGPKVQNNFIELYTNKEPSVYVGETAPADTTRLFLDSNEEAGVLVQKKYVTGTGWVRVGSHGVQYATSCASINGGMCVDAAGKLYYHNGTAVVEVGSGGSVDLSAYLSKTNTTAFTPTSDYHPATMKFVLDSITAGGGYTDEQAQDAVGLMLSGNTETGITVTYDDVTGKINFVSPTTLASFTDDSTHRLVTDTEKGTWNAKQDAVSKTPISASIITDLFVGTGACLGSNGKKVDCGDSAGGIPHVASGYPSTSGAWNFNTTDYKLYTRLENGSVYSTAPLTSVATADVTPTGFAFTDVTDATISTEYTACDQVTGIDWPATVTASSPAAAVCTGDNTGCGAFGTSPGTVANNGWVCARHTSSASNSTATNTPVTVGTVSDTFTSTTVAPSGDAQITAYFNCNSATTGQSLQKGTGTVTIGGGVATITGQVGNALDNTDTTYSGGRLTIPTASGNLDWSVGTLGFWAYFPANEYERAVHAETNVDAFKLAYDYGAQYTFTFRGGTASASISAAGWHFVELAWDYGNTRNSIRVDGGSWSSPGAANGATAPSGNLILLSETGGSTTDMWIDQVIISTTYQKDLYAQRMATSF